MDQYLPRIPKKEYETRSAKVKQLMAKMDLDVVIAYSNDRATFGAAHGRWLANFPAHFEPVLVLFTRTGTPKLLMGPETVGYAQLQSEIKDIRALTEFTHPDEDYPFIKIENLIDIIAETMDVGNVKRIGIAGMSLMDANISAALKTIFSQAAFLDIEHEMCMLRAIKTDAEIEVIKYAYSIANDGFNAALDALQPGVTERKIAAAAEAAMRNAGSEGTGIDTIVASGVNTIPILARTTFREVGRDDVVVITVAPRYEGYHGAIARTIVVGNPGSEIIRRIETQTEAQLACFRALKPKVEGSIAEGKGRAIMEKAGYGEFFLYSGIHSVGVVEFEPPIFGPSSSGTLENGMVLSVDIPLFEAPGYGSRIEDGYLIQHGECLKLNENPYSIRI